MREPCGINSRLTLKDFYSEGLQHEYNAIYRTSEEYSKLIKNFLVGFEIINEGYMFEQDELNNRKETVQYYYILKRS